MNDTDPLKGNRKHKRLIPAKDDCIYCIVANAESTFKSISLMAVDLSEKGFKFTTVPSLTGYFKNGQKLFLKGIGGSLNITFAEPVELCIRWQKHHAEKNLVDVGFEICSMSEQSRQQLVELIHSDRLGGQLKQHLTVLSLFGGHRQNGNTAKILGWIEDDLKILGHRVERINLVDKKVNGCTNCLECKKNFHSPGCIQKDDFLQIVGKMLKSDIVIFASPLYHRYLSVQMRALFGRFNCLYRGELGTAEHTSFVEGQLQSLILTSVNSYEAYAEQIVKSFQRTLQLSKTHSAGKLIVCDCTSPDELNGQVRGHAAAFAEQLFILKTVPYSLLIPRTKASIPAFVP